MADTAIMLETSLLGLEALVTDLALPIVTTRSVSIAVREMLIEPCPGVEPATTALPAVRHLGEAVGGDGRSSRLKGTRWRWRPVGRKERSERKE